MKCEIALIVLACFLLVAAVAVTAAGVWQASLHVLWAFPLLAGFAAVMTYTAVHYQWR